jgi:hypothetical protein
MPAPAPGFTAGLAAVAGAVSVAAPDWKYEQPDTTTAASRMRGRII